MTLGERILQYRTARDWSQEDLAAALEVSRQSVSKWETDASTPELDKIVRLSEIFEVSLDQLVTGSEPSPEPQEPQTPPPVESIPETPAKLPAGKIIQIVLGGVFLLLGAVLGILLLLMNGGHITLILITPLLLCGVIFGGAGAGAFIGVMKAGRCFSGWTISCGSRLALHGRSF